MLEHRTYSISYSISFPSARYYRTTPLLLPHDALYIYPLTTPMVRPQPSSLAHSSETMVTAPSSSTRPVAETLQL